MMFFGFPNFLACNAEVHATLSLFSCFLAVTYNIDFALLLPLLLLLELNIVVVGAESRILVAPFFALLCFALLLLMAEPSSKRPKESNIRMQRLLFKALKADGNNYLEWNIDAKSYIRAKELDITMESPTPRDLPIRSKW